MNISLFSKYLIGSGIINIIIFNYNIHNVDIIRNNKKTKLLPSERLVYSLCAFTVGLIKIPIYIDCIYIKLIKGNPEDYNLIKFPNKEIDYEDIFKNL